MKKYKHCIKCGEIFYKTITASKNEWEKSKYCSRRCHYEYHREEKICPICSKSFVSLKCYSRKFCSMLCRNRSRPDRGGKIELICQLCGKKFIPLRRGFFGKNQKYCSKYCANLDKCGKNHWNWKGGKTGINYLMRNRKEYRNWRNAVYRKDNWTCQNCGEHCDSKNIVAHHIKDWDNFPELRYDVKNGIVLCRVCHKIRHQEMKILNKVKMG